MDRYFDAERLTVNFSTMHNTLEWMFQSRNNIMDDRGFRNPAPDRVEGNVYPRNPEECKKYVKRYCGWLLVRLNDRFHISVNYSNQHISVHLVLMITLIQVF